VVDGEYIMWSFKFINPPCVAMHDAYSLVWTGVVCILDHNDARFNKPSGLGTAARCEQRETALYAKFSD